jgi:hypothetical protein
MNRLRSLVLGSLALVALALVAPAVRADDMDKYVPEGTDFYVHVNLKQLCGASMMRKVLPKVMDKYGEELLKMAAAQNPQAAMAQQMWPQFQEMLRDQEQVDQFFDAAADHITSIIIAGSTKDEGETPNMIVLFGFKDVTSDLVGMIAQQAGAFMPGMLKEEKLGDKEVWVMTPPGAPMGFYLGVPRDGVLAFSPNKAAMTKAMKGGSKEPTFTADAKAFLKHRTDKSSVFFCMDNRKEEQKGYGQVMIAGDMEVNVVMEYKDAQTAKSKADETNEEIGKALNQLETMAGAAGEKLKPILETVKKSQAKADGNKMTMNLKITADSVLKALKD